MHIKSFKDIVEVAIKSAWEAQLIEAYETLVREFDQRWENKRETIRKDIKKEANRLTLEMLQKADLNGLSVEIKL